MFVTPIKSMDVLFEAIEQETSKKRKNQKNTNLYNLKSKRQKTTTFSVTEETIISQTVTVKGETSVIDDTDFLGNPLARRGAQSIASKKAKIKSNIKSNNVAEKELKKAMKELILPIDKDKSIIDNCKKHLSNYAKTRTSDITKDIKLFKLKTHIKNLETPDGVSFQKLLKENEALKTQIKEYESKQQYYNKFAICLHDFSKTKPLDLTAVATFVQNNSITLADAVKIHELIESQRNTAVAITSQQQ